MLSRMERDRPISNAWEFAQCLRQVFAAKNSLSRVNGFTPEQCLLGKSRRLPGSLVSDAEASSHSLADSDTPEGQIFEKVCTGESWPVRPLCKLTMIQRSDELCCDKVDRER